MTDFRSGRLSARAVPNNPEGPMRTGGPRGPRVQPLGARSHAATRPDGRETAPVERPDALQPHAQGLTTSFSTAATFVYTAHWQIQRMLQGPQWWPTGCPIPCAMCATQKRVYQKWPNNSFPTANLVFPTMVPLVWWGGGVRGRTPPPPPTAHSEGGTPRVFLKRGGGCWGDPPNRRPLVFVRGFFLHNPLPCTISTRDSSCHP